METRSLHPEDLVRIKTYLGLPQDALLPADPLQFLTEYLHLLPRSLLEPFTELTTPRDRARLRPIKARRLMYASTTPTPSFLSADAGRTRWPLLWERMGGSSLPPPSLAVQEEESWVRDRFLGGEAVETDGDERKVRQHVKKLGGLLRGFEEEREMEIMRERKRVERRLDEVGEEFDSESDEEEGVGGRIGNTRIGAGAIEDEDQDGVARAFEKKLVELFVDGLDSIPYDDIDFTEPPDGDPIATRDAQDRYFDDEEASRTPNGHEAGSGTSARPLRAAPEIAEQNGKGDYDY